MRWFSGLSTLVFAGFLLASPATVYRAYAHDGSAGASASDSYEGQSLPYGDAKTMQDRMDKQTMANPPLRDESTSVEGQVAAVDHESGQLVLDTDKGLVDVQVAPDELTQVDVGDVIRVSFVQDLSE